MNTTTTRRHVTTHRHNPRRAAVALALLAACQAPSGRDGEQGASVTAPPVEQRQQALSEPLPELGFTLNTVLGQADANQAAINRVVPSAGFNIAGVHIRRNSPTDVKIFVADGGNNRVLIFNGYKPQGTNADFVLGQPSGTDNMAPNGDVAVRRAPTASKLAFFSQPILSPTEEAIGIHLDTDAAGNLYVPDAGNNRVLKYNNPFTDATPTVADDVWGQPGFTTLAEGQGPAQMFLEPRFWVKTVGLDVDAQGNLWVCDPGNHRVMLFRKVGTTIEKQASLCLGQPNCTGGGLGTLGRPVSVQVTADGQTVWVLDGNTDGDDIGPSRLVKYRSNGAGGYDVDPAFVSPTFAHPRGMTLDGNTMWIADTDTQRFLKFDTTNFGAAPGMFNVLLPGGSVTTFPGGVSRIQLFMGLGSFGIDTDTILFAWHIRGAGIGSEHYFPGLVRLSKQLPGPPEVPVTSLHLSPGENAAHPGALSSLHGMILAGSQLVQSDTGLLKVYNTPESKSGLATPDFVLDVGDRGPRRLMSTGGGKLFVSAGTAVQIFQLPITSSTQAPLRVLESGMDITWANGGTVAFDGVSLGAGLAYDAGKDVLWLADNARFRVLRVRDPLGAAVVDLALGQTSKTAISRNGGLPAGTVNKGVFGAVFSLALDNFGNLYVTDSTFEGNGNRRLLRFDAGKLVPPAGNAIFFNPPLPADAIFGKRTWAVDPSEFEPHWPNHPVSVAFDRDNHMYLLADGYGDSTLGGQRQVDAASFERIFFYERPHLGVDTIVPDRVIKAPFGQAAFASFANGAPDRMFVQDHTWARIVQLSIQGVPSGTTVTLPAAADAHVRDGTSAGTNFGALATLEQKRSTVAGNHRRTFLRFDVGAVSGTVTGARLRLRGNSVTSAKLVGVFAVANVTWGETTITWNNAPTIGAKLGGSQNVGTSAAFIEWDVGSYLAAQKAAGATAVSFELKQDVANNEGPTTFSSRQATSNQPELVVTTSSGGGNQPPTVATPPAASPNPVTGTSTTLSVLGADDGGEPALTYTWSATGPAGVSFSANGSNAAKTSTATFTASGSYQLTVVIRDAGNLTASASVTVPVTVPGGTVTLPAAADAHVRDGTSAGTNFGLAATLEQKNSTVAGNNRRTFVRFDLGGVSGTVSNARLRLNGNSVTSAKLVGVFAVASVTWGETSITWNNAPAIGAKLGASQNVGTSAAFIEWDVTSYVAAQKAAGATAVSFELKQDVANNETPTSFSSRQAAGNRPELRVTTP